MKAAFLVEPGRIEVRDVDKPKPAPGELIVRVEAALTCGTDLKAYRRGHPFIPMPGPFGHQYAGVIEDVGDNAPNLAPGTPILGVHSGPCGACSLCAVGKFHLCEHFAEQLVIGAFAEYLRIRPRVARVNVHPRPSNLPAVRAAFLEPVSCCVHALRLIDFTHAKNVLVLGLGSMGLIFLQLLPFFSSARRVGAGRKATRLAMAHSYGLDQVVDVTQRPITEVFTGPDRFDVVIECTGRPEGWQEAIDLTLPGGQVMLFGGLPKGSTFPVDTYRLHYEELRLLGSFHFTPEDVQISAQKLADPTLRLEDMIEAERPLAGLEDALVAMSEGKGIKYAIIPSLK